MSTCDGQYELICRREFAAIQAKLDRLDEAIRGNSKPGILLRLDRLEAAEATRSRLLWLIAGSVVSLTAATLWALVVGG